MPSVLTLPENTPPEVTAALTIAATRTNLLVVRVLAATPQTTITKIHQTLKNDGINISKSAVHQATRALAEAGVAQRQDPPNNSQPVQWSINNDYVANLWQKAGTWILCYE